MYMQHAVMHLILSYLTRVVGYRSLDTARLFEFGLGGVWSAVAQAEHRRLSVGMTIVYDASELNEISVLMRWRGTIMAMVLTRPVIWILVGIHYFFLHLHLEREDIELPMLPWSIVGVPTSLLTFFLVFYSGNCFARYYALYGKCMSMNGAVTCAHIDRKSVVCTSKEPYLCTRRSSDLCVHK